MILETERLLLVDYQFSSNYDNAFKSMKYLIKDKVMWAVIIGTIVGLLIMLYTPLNRILNLASLTIAQLFIAVGIAAISVLWYEIVKIFNNMNLSKNN